MHERKTRSNVIGDSMKNCIGRNVAARFLCAVVAVIAFAPALAFAEYEWNFQPPVTSSADQIVTLHNLIFWICAVIFVGVFGVMFYSLYRHRKSVGHQAVQFHENTLVEIVWTIIPFLILLFMAYPATKTILAMHDTSAPDMTRSEERRVGKECRCRCRPDR